MEIVSFFFPVGSLNRVKLKVVSLFCWQTGCSGILLTCSLWPLRAWAFLLTPTEIEHPSNICRAHLHSAWHTELPLTAISQALYSPVSTVLVKIAAKISPGIGTHASGESKKANKYIRYGSFVVYTHTHTHSRALEAPTAWPRIELIKRELKCEGFFLSRKCKRSVRVKHRPLEKCQRKVTLCTRGNKCKERWGGNKSSAVTFGAVCLI